MRQESIYRIENLHAEIADIIEQEKELLDPNLNSLHRQIALTRLELFALPLKYREEYYKGIPNVPGV